MYFDDDGDCCYQMLPSVEPRDTFRKVELSRIYLLDTVHDADDMDKDDALVAIRSLVVVAAVDVVVSAAAVHRHPRSCSNANPEKPRRRMDDDTGLRAVAWGDADDGDKRGAKPPDAIHRPLRCW